MNSVNKSVSLNSNSLDCSDIIMNDSDTDTINNQNDSYGDKLSLQVRDTKNNNNNTLNDVSASSNKQNVNSGSNNGNVTDKEMPNSLLKSSSNAVIDTNKPKPKQSEKLKPSASVGITPTIAITKENVIRRVKPVTISTVKQTTQKKVSAPTTPTKSIIKKTQDTKISEEIMGQLYQTGQMPNTLGYNYLLTKIMHSKEKANLKSINNSNDSMDVKERKKTIQQFLQRSNIYLSQKQLNLDRKCTAKGNGINGNQTAKAKNATLEITYRTSQNNNKPFKGHVRSPDKFKSDQDKFAEEKKRRIEAKRKEIELMKEKENKPKPTINANSKKIASRAHSMKDKKVNIHHKLYQEMHERALSKEKQIKEHLALEDEMNNKNQMKPVSQEEISNVVEKLYKEGLKEKKKKEQSSIPCHMEEVNVFFAREYSNYQSYIRTNTTKQVNMTDAIDEFYDTTRVIREENKDKGHNLILLKKLMKEIDGGLNTIAFQSQLSNVKNKEDSIDIPANDNNANEEVKDINRKRTISFNQYNQLLFHIGMLHYNHWEFINYINTNYPDKANDQLFNYNRIQWNDIKLDDIVIRHIPSSVKITKLKMVTEYKKLEESWNLLTETDNSNSNTQVDINKIKLFILSVIGIYSGESNIINEKQPIHKSCSTSSLNSKKNKSNKCIMNYINNNIIKNYPELHFDKKKAQMIYAAYELFRENNSEYETYFRKEKNKKKLFNYASNPKIEFKPSINLTSNNSIKSSDSYSKIELAYEIMRKKKEKEKEKEMLLKEKAAREMKECTFLPNNHHIDKTKSNQASSRLYSYLKPKKNNNNTSIANKSKINISKEEEYTFSPKLNPPLSNRLFNGKSIKDNPHVSSKVDQYNKARLEKKLIQFMSTQGGMALAKIRTSEDLMEYQREGECVKQFEFGIEKKSNKFAFEAFSKKSNMKRYDNRMNLPLFTIEVKIKNKIELLDYYKDDVPSDITSKFCIKHYLGESSKTKIISVIEEKLQSMELL